MKVTQQDIAEKLNITRTTVARALNNSGPVSEDLREKILATAKEMGYRVNVHARSLGKKYNIQIDVFLLEFYESDFVDGLISGIKKAEWEAASYGIKVDIHVISPKTVEEQIQMMERVIVTKNTNAVVFIPHSSVGIDPFLKYCKQQSILVGTLDILIENRMLDFHVGPDYFNSGYIAAGMSLRSLPQVQKAGFKKKFLLFTRTDDYEVSLRGNGYIARMYKEPDVEVIKVVFDFDATTLATVAKRSLRKNPDVCGIYSVIKIDEILDLLSDEEKQRIVLISNDLSAKNRMLLKDGVLNAIIYHRPIYQGYTAIKTVLDILMKERELQNKYFETFTDIVIPENVDNFNKNEIIGFLF